MAISPQQVDLWRQASTENQRLEFKEAKTQYDSEKLYKYCVALANEGGGHFLMGVADKPPRPVVGSQALNDVVGAAEKLFHAVGFRVEVDEVLHPEGRVVVLTIPSRPRGTAYNLNGAYWMRNGEELIPMTEDRLRVIFDEGRPDWLEHHSKTGLDAQAVVELLDTQAYFELLKLPYPTERAGVIDRLVKERLVDETVDGLAIRRLGALMLAKQLVDFPDVARKASRVVVYNGTSKLETKMDRAGARGYASGFQGFVKFVMAQLPQNEVIKDALRTEVTLVPEVVVRELLANALIHQDLSMGGASVMAEIYSDRLEISNPGVPIVETVRFIDGYQSRNERLADLMRRLGVCEEKGSGIDRVVQAAEMYQLPAPDFWVGHHRTVVRIFGHRPFEEMLREDRVRACYQHAALRWVMGGHMTNQSLRDRFNLIHTKASVTSQIISATVDQGLIKLDEKVGGSRKYARYLPFWA